MVFPITCEYESIFHGLLELLFSAASGWERKSVTTVKLLFHVLTQNREEKNYDMQ